MKSELAMPRLRQREFWVTDGADIVSPEWPSVDKTYNTTHVPLVVLCVTRMQFLLRSYLDEEVMFAQCGRKTWIAMQLVSTHKKVVLWRYSNARLKLRHWLNMVNQSTIGIVLAVETLFGMVPRFQKWNGQKAVYVIKTTIIIHGRKIWCSILFVKSDAVTKPFQSGCVLCMSKKMWNKQK